VSPAQPVESAIDKSEGVHKLSLMFTAATTVPGLRPWLASHDGELLIEPVPGITLDPTASRLETSEHLEALTSFGVCGMTLQQEDGATYFTIVSGDHASMLVYDDDSDRLVAIVPHTDDDRLWN